MSDTANITLPSSTYRIPSGLAYLKTPDAILEIMEALACLGSVVSIAATTDRPDDESAYWHLMAASGAFCVVTTVIVILYVIGIPQKMTRIPWSMLEVFYCTGAFIALMALASHVAANTFGWAGLIIGTILAFVAMVIYFVEIFFAIRAWKRSIIAETLRLVEEGKLGTSIPPAHAMKENNSA